MTNFNERLDEILQAVYNNGTIRQWKLSETKLGTIPVWITNEQAKQAITSIMKELVAEAKPERSETQLGNFIIYGDLSKRDLNIINQFERNILKALEEV